MAIKTRFHYDPSTPDVMRLQTDSLCHQLDVLVRKLDDGTLKAEDLQQDFNSSYRPDAVALAEAMLHYVPDHDPRIMMVAGVGNFRSFKSDDMTTIDMALMPEIAATQIRTITKMLRELTTYLPSN
jgi:hypothetical protein